MFKTRSTIKYGWDTVFDVLYGTKSSPKYSLKSQNKTWSTRNFWDKDFLCFYGIVNNIMGNEEDAFHSLFNMTCRGKESKSNIRKISKRIELESYSKTHHEFFQTQFEFQRNSFKHVLFFSFTPETYSSILIFCSIRHISVIFLVITERFYSRILDLP